MITEFKMDKQFIESALGLNRGRTATESETYTGTMIEDLQERAERVERVYVEFVARQTRLCRICRQTYADHSHENGFCPTGLDRGPFFNPSRRFTEITCQASVGDTAYQCDRECVPGTEYCAKHYEE